MKIQFRKDRSPWNWNKEIYEWKPTENLTWFKIHRKNIAFKTSKTPEGYTFQRTLFNQTLQGKTLTLKAQYYAKTLIIEGMEND
ncbi:MAG: hypothetical protein QHH15_02020 [Candidatus Thermoplasmatota archaeon]|jgi:flavin-dependent dehydrogenase|nr:hypothetical protein [Candidatus Thermoplasmatota archaeon]